VAGSSFFVTTWAVGVAVHVDRDGQGFEVGLLLLGPGKLVARKDPQVQLLLRHFVGHFAPIRKPVNGVVEPRFALDEVLQRLQRTFFLFGFQRTKASGRANAEDVNLGLLSVHRCARNDQEGAERPGEDEVGTERLRRTDERHHDVCTSSTDPWAIFRPEGGFSAKNEPST